jgi:shikimate dehydrogenase
MSPSQVLQPLVCCLGDPVAGNPTQFVMSRAASEAGLDWRFFTSHVLKSDFEAAVRGIQALGLQGFAILEPYGESVLPFLDTVTEAGLALGKVSVARSDATSWLGDNLFGQAILSVVQRHIGSFPTEGSASGAKRRQLVLVASVPVAKCLSIASHGLFLDIIVVPNSPSVTLSEFWPDGATRVGAGLLVEGKLSKGLAKQLSAIDWDQGGIFLQLDRSITDVAADLEYSKQLGLHAIESIELHTQEAVCNFQFWTGITPSWDVVKESLEEYLSY